MMTSQLNQTTFERPGASGAPAAARHTTLLVTEIFPPAVGGSGRWFWEVYRRLPRREVVVAAGVDPGQDEFDRTHDLRVVRLPLRIRPPGLMRPSSLAKYVRAFRVLRRVVRDEGVHAVHCGCCLPEGLLGLALKSACGVPYVCFAHGEEFEFASTSRELTWLARRVLSGASLVVANSQNTAGVLTANWGLSRDRVRVLHPGVDTARFRPARRDPAVRAGLGWGERPVVLTVGRLQKAKGHDRMIEAVGRLRDAVPDVLYAIAGDGQERRALEALVGRSGLGAHVQFLGRLGEADLVRCYQQCDLFVLPSRRVGPDVEGFGIVLLEAQACGKPVIAGAVGGTAETMDLGRTGRVVPCEDPEALAGAVAGLLLDPPALARMGADARRWAVERFDWDALVRQAAPWLGAVAHAPGGCAQAGGLVAR
jgi:phosphatidylinositol alpha-1,6-mannosyltransferase